MQNIITTKSIPWLLLIIGAGLVYVFWPDTSKQSARELELQAALERRTAAYNESERRGTKLLLKLESDSVSHKIEVQTYKDRDKKKSAYIANLKANPTIVKVRSEVPEVDSLIHTYDTLLASKDAQLHMQGKYISTLQVDATQLTHNFEERIALQDSTINDQRAIIADLTNRLNKKKTVWQKLGQIGKDILKVGAGVVIGRISK